MEAGPEAEAVEERSILTCSHSLLTLLIVPKISYSGLASIVTDCVLPHQSLREKISHILAYRSA